MIEVPATIEVPGEVHLIGSGTPVPDDRVCIRPELGPARQTADSIAGPGLLYVEGARVGHAAYIDTLEVDSFYEAGNPNPVERVVRSTTIRCVLELGAR